MADSPNPKQPASGASTPPSSEASTAPSSCGCEPSAQSPGTVKNTQEGLSQADFDACADLPVLDADGKSHTFKSLYTDSDKAHQRLLIFVRHFFCGNCRDYIRALSHSLPPSGLSELSPPTSITIISCGDPSLIPSYTSATSCPYPIFTDPTRQLYTKLGMIRTLDLGPTKPAYQQSSLLGLVVSSFWQALSSGTNAVRGGDFWQVGGELVVREGKVVWGRRMRNTRDHAEVEKLRGVLGMAGNDGTNEKSERRSFSVVRGLMRRSSTWARRNSAGRKGSESPLESKTTEKERTLEREGEVLQGRAVPAGIGAEL